MGRSFYILIVLLFCFYKIDAQNPVPKSEEKSIALGLDVSGLALPLIEPGLLNYEFSLIGGSYKKIYAVAELGQMNFLRKKDDAIKKYDYRAMGKYAKIGFDYNMYNKNLPGENNLVFSGIRYGFSNTNHSAKNIFIRDTIWPARYAELPETHGNTHWVELLGGIRVQFFEHFAMGWTFRYKIMLSNGFSEGFYPYYLAGYGKSANGTSLGFTYSLFYTIPILKIKAHIE